jgi:hypothetical protein
MAFTGIQRNQCGVEGGIKHMLLIRPDATNLNITQASGEVTSLATTGTVTAYKIEGTKQNGYANEVGTGNKDNNSFYFQQEIQMKGHGINTDVITAIESIRAQKWIAIVHFANGISRLFGTQFGMFPNASTANSNEALADGNEFTITLMGEEIQPAYKLKNSTAALPYGDCTADLAIVAFA